MILVNDGNHIQPIMAAARVQKTLNNNKKWGEVRCVRVRRIRTNVYKCVAENGDVL